MKELPTDLPLDDIAHDVAVQYFPRDVICFRYGLTDYQMRELEGTAEFKRQVLNAQKSIASSGEGFRLKAAEEAGGILKEFARMALDEQLAPGTRLRAGELVAQWAGGGYGGAQAQSAGLGLQIVLQTNLDLGRIGTSDGVYEAHALEVEDEDDLIG